MWGLGGWESDLLAVPSQNYNFIAGATHPYKIPNFISGTAHDLIMHVQRLISEPPKQPHRVVSGRLYCKTDETFLR